MSEKVPSAVMILAELLKAAGLPDGVFQVVHGDIVAAVTADRYRRRRRA